MLHALLCVGRWARSTSLGVEEVESILSERADVEVGCDFCGQQYRFDAVDAAQIFRDGVGPVSDSSLLH